MTDFATDPADILEKAVELLESDKVEWIQGSYHRIELGQSAPTWDGPYVDGYCAMGAMREVAGLGNLNSIGVRNNALSILSSSEQQKRLNRVRAAENALLLETGHTSLQFAQIENWNDKEGRTEEEVIEAMKHAAKELRNRATAA